MHVDVERLLIVKGVLEGDSVLSKPLDKKEELENELANGSSFLQNQLNDEEITALNNYLEEKERKVELQLDPATINYRDCLLDSYRGVEDPYQTEIAELNYNQNPVDPSFVIREVVYKKVAASAQMDGASTQN
jgi:hypothetical protein